MKTFLHFVVLKFITWGVLILFYTGCEAPTSRARLNPSSDFTFVFLTDIHLQPERDALRGFSQLIDSVNALKPDFVITGGDLIYDVLGVGFERADSLYKMYDSLMARFDMPVYNAMGNHEAFGIYEKSGVDASHPEFGKKMFENRIGPRYQAFDHKGWKFFILDSFEATEEKKYRGHIDEEQMEWLKNQLDTIPQDKPIAIVSHIPFVTVGTQLLKGSLAANEPNIVVTNSKDVLSLFEGHNLQIVLQGHLHVQEYIEFNGLKFLTGGAVSGRWWRGANNGMPESYVKLQVSSSQISHEFKTFGWQAVTE